MTKHGEVSNWDTNLRSLKFGAGSTEEKAKQYHWSEGKSSDSDWSWWNLWEDWGATGSPWRDLKSWNIGNVVR